MALVETIDTVLRSPSVGLRFDWPAAVEESVDSLARELAPILPQEACPPPYELRRALLDVDGYVERRLRAIGDSIVSDILDRHRQRLSDAGVSLPDVESSQRYAWIGELAEECIVRRPPRERRRSEQIDNVVTHRVLGSLIFCAIMGGIFISVFEWSASLMELVDSVFGTLTEAIHGALGEGVLASFLADGVVAGVGGVLIFLPQILILIGMITILEDCGYLARAAFLIDRLLRTVGLGGRSFVPLLSSFACAIPGIMAARTIESPRERLITILVAPLMACSARIPIYTILVVAFVPEKLVLGFLPLQGLVFAAMYFFGIVVAAIAALILKKTVFRGPEAPFLLELPSYKVPSVRAIVLRMYDRGKDFLVSAGTIILAMSVIIWALLYFPRPAAVEQNVRAQMVQAGVTEEERIDKAVAGAYLRQSVLGRIGHAIEPAVKPLGWDWKIGTAAIAAFPAREVVVSTLGIIYNLGPDEDATSTVLHEKLRAATWPDGRKVFNLPVALSIMVFFALCCQCQATVAIIKRETNSWRWPIFVFSYMTVLAYVAALLVYQVGSRLA